MSNTRDLTSIPYLSDADVNLLHEIVKRAQQSTQTPSRALFEAHDQLLREHGISDREQKYTRFLLRMRNTPDRQTTPLIDQFSSLLLRLGIRPVYDVDDESNAPASDNDGPPPYDGHDQPPGDMAQAQKIHNRPRRASFNEYEDSLQMTPQEHPLGGVQLPIRPLSHNELNARPFAGPHIENARDSRPVEQAIAPGLEQRDSQDLARNTSTKSRKPMVQIREDPSIYEFEQSVASDEVSDTDEDDSRDLRFKASAPTRVRGTSNLDKVAADFRYRRLAAQAHRHFHAWQTKTRNSQLDRQRKSQQAQHLDRNVLRKQALEQWRDKFLARQQEKKTEQFFEALEQRAERARDLFLITKSFTHWAQSTSDEILRTSAARRHILRTRFFNAWRDVTAVNELKVRRQGISKFFFAWRKRKSQLSTLEQTAVDFRSSHLAQTSYRDWFWEFCDRKAPTWRDHRIQDRYWDHWSQLAHGYTIRDRWSEGYARLQLLRKIWSKWREGFLQRQQTESSADTYRRRTLIIQAVEAWRRKMFFQDPVGRMTRARETKSKATILQTWLAQARLSLVSKKAHDSRLMRNAWTTWNDRLRCQALQHAINERVIIQALLRWILVSRLRLFKRVSAETRKRKLFSSWRRQTRRTCSSVGRAEHWVSLARTTHMQSNALHKWRTKSQSLRAAETRAQDMSDQRTLSKVIGHWRARTQACQEMDRWSGRFEFRAFNAHAFQLWYARLEHRKKQRRRDAYAHVRKQHKVMLVRRIFQHWRGRAEEVSSNALRAQQHSNGLLISSWFFEWLTKARQYASDDRTALEARDRDILQKAWASMLSRWRAVQDQHAQAEQYWTDCVELPAAADCLKRLDFHRFQLRAQNQIAEDFRRRNEEKHYRLMLRRWDDVTKQRRRQQSPPQSPSLPALQPPAATNFNISVMAAATPAYLQSPSRRTTGRLRTRIPAAPTTPGPSYITPFRSRLRDHYPNLLPRPARLERDQRRGRLREVVGIAESSPVRGSEEG